MGVGGFNTRSIGMTALVVVLIAGLFFIPEILSFRKSFSGGTTAPSTKVAAPIPETKSAEVKRLLPAAAAEVTKVEAPAAESFLNRVVSYFKTEKGTSPVELRQSQQYSVPRGMEQSAKRSVGSSTKAGMVEALDDGVTWRRLKSKDSLASLRTASEQAVALAKGLPSRYRESGQALYAYAGGIKYVLSNAENNMEAGKAFRFLEQLDAAVTDAMLKEKVPSADYNSWTRITLGPAFAQSTLLRMKGFRQKPFNPNLRVVSVRVQQPGNYQGKFLANGRAYLHLVGTVEGADVDHIEIYRDGMRLRDRKPRHADRTGLRYFFMRGQNARGQYLFRVMDRGGQEFTKIYNFYSRVQSFPWSCRRGGMYIFPLGEGDPRMDRMFVVRGGLLRREGGITYFTTAVGKDFATF